MNQPVYENVTRALITSTDEPLEKIAWPLIFWGSFEQIIIPQEKNVEVPVGFYRK